MSEQHQKLIELIADMNEEEAIKLANAMLDDGYDPMKLLEHCRAGMDVVGKRFESGEYFLPELMLDINGYKVIDLGIDVPIDTFIDSIKEHQPSVVGLSGFLTLAFDSMKETIDAIQSAGLRDDIKIMIGGGQVDDTIRNYTGADAFGLNAMSAVSLCNGWAQATA